MKVLLDEMLPIGVRQLLPEHQVMTAGFVLIPHNDIERIRAYAGGFRRRWQPSPQGALCASLISRDCPVTTQPTMTPAAFAQKWKGVTTTEKAGSQSHSIDLCRMLGEPTPNEADPTGEHYAFEKRVTKGGGGDGFADVWKRGFFAWEYKGKRADLKAAYKQLLYYREDLENPPLLIVSDIERIEIHTNFTGLKPVVQTITLAELAADPTRALFLLRDVFAAPEEFRPRIEPSQITEKAARSFADIAQGLRARGHDPEAVAHFLDRILFCLFAEDAGLLPKGILGRLSLAARGRSEVFTNGLAELFGKMSHARPNAPERSAQPA